MDRDYWATGFVSYGTALVYKLIQKKKVGYMEPC